MRWPRFVPANKKGRHLLCRPALNLNRILVDQAWMPSIVGGILVT
jgi:hypothetical protein